MSLTVINEQRAPQQQSFGAKMGSSIGEGLSNIIEEKVSNLKKAQGIHDRKATYKKASLPEWLAELPDDMQALFLKEFDFAPEEQKETMREELEDMGQKYIQPDLEDGSEQKEQGLLPQQMTNQAPQLQQDLSAKPTPQDSLMQQKESTIPGMNSLMQAGESARDKTAGSEGSQAFPSLGRGVQGQPSDMGGLEGQSAEATIPKQPRLVRKQKGSSAPKSDLAERKFAAEQKENAEKKSKSKERVQKTFDRAQEILDAGYTGYTPFGLTPEGRKQRSEFDTLSEVFISEMIPLLNPRGAMSKERFNYIKSLVPNSWDTDAAIKGKLDALKDILELEGASPEKSTKEAVTKKQATPGTVEMRDAAGDIYDIPEDRVEAARKGGLR